MVTERAVGGERSSSGAVGEGKALDCAFFRRPLDAVELRDAARDGAR